MTAPFGKAEKYARRERERRFLLASVPDAPAPVRVARITDLYVIGSRLRLRRAVERTASGEDTSYKLAQKIPDPGGGPGLITNLYLSAGEYETLTALPGRLLTKTRYSIPPFGVDVFEGPLDGLVMAEIEFDSDSGMRDFSPPDFAVAEVTSDSRFTGGQLVSASPSELRSWLEAFGIEPPFSPS